MKLYFSPLACSLATRIALYEAGALATYLEVDPRTRKTPDGGDYLAVHPLGLVPALEVASGQLLTENAAILQFVAARHPGARLAPEDPWQRAQLQQWLCFVGTELHKVVYFPLLDRAAPGEARAYALSKAGARLGWLADRLAGREFLLEHFTVADAYLFTVLNWSPATPIDLAAWPTLRAYHARLLARPSIARAFADERPLYFKERPHPQPAAVSP